MVQNADNVLECVNISKDFGNLKVLKQVNIKIGAGERRAILGPNGAGKTTLFNIICGELPYSGGQVFIHGKEVTHEPSYTRIRHGFSRTFQLTNLFFGLTAAENVFMALHGCRPRKFLYLKPVRFAKDLHEQALGLLDQFYLSHLAQEKVENISYGDQRLLEIVLAMCGKPTILALDEPSSGLSSAERQKLSKVLQNLDRRLTLVFIEHDMDLVSEVAETVSVLHHGVVMAEASLNEVKNNPVVREAYMGGGDKMC